MVSVDEMLRSRPGRKFVCLALIAVGAAGCSAETARFNDNPFASNTAPPPESTGSIQRTAPVAQVQSSQLPPPPAPYRPASAYPPPASGHVTSGGGMASFTPPPAAQPMRAPSPPPAYTPASPQPEVTGSVVARHSAPPPSQWTWDGGTAVTVTPGETVEVISRRYGVPVSAIMQANNMHGPHALQPGQRLVIPRYVGTGTPVASAPATRVAAAPAKPIAAPVATGATEAAIPAGAGYHVVAAGDTLSRIARLYHKPVGEIARANNIAATQTLKIGDRIVIPGWRTSDAKHKNAPAVAQGQPLAPPQKPVAAATEAPARESAAMATPVGETPAPATPMKAAENAGKPSFRWPVKGRVIAGFGPKTSGGQNDGINVAVPENTPIKAAEDGVVAYAGNELKGYGNLVLIRHSNGYVTAYAHAKELLVKRGDPIKRGQVIAKSGQTGNVDAPQVHFEIRKGPTPQDPMPMLSGG